MSDSLISETELRKLAGERYFERGMSYFRNGAVARLRMEATGISARVIGTEPYAVRLWRSGSKLAWGCSCPLGADREFCKHLVAVGLTWLAGGEVPPDPSAEDEYRRVCKALRMLDRDVLIDFIAERAAWDETWQGEIRLLTEALKQTRNRKA